MRLETSSNRIHVSRSASFAVLFALAACTAQTQDNFTNPPPGPPSTCTSVTALAGCGAGSVSYSCTSARPDDGDTNLICDQGVPGAGSGEVLYCCAPYAQWASECEPATGVAGCGTQSLGFSCAGSTSPDQADTSLVCSSSVAGDGGATDYCCVSFDQSAAICRCSSFDEGSAMCGVAASQDCARGGIGFDCAGAHTPSEVNPLLECTTPDGGASGSYCCQTP